MAEPKQDAFKGREEELQDATTKYERAIYAAQFKTMLKEFMLHMEGKWRGINWSHIL